LPHAGAHPDDAAQFVAHRPKDFVYAVPRETLAGENAITFADSQK
jgi:hypothetical protein